MADFNIKELEKMAKLALSAEEEKEMTRYMEFLTGDFGKLSEVCTDGVEPMVFGAELINVFRDDIPAEYANRDALLKNAPEQENGYFKTPRTVE